MREIWEPFEVLLLGSLLEEILLFLELLAN